MSFAEKPGANAAAAFAAAAGEVFFATRTDLFPGFKDVRGHKNGPALDDCPDGARSSGSDVAELARKRGEPLPPDSA
jgi:hypothetical protein